MTNLKVKHPLNQPKVCDGCHHMSQKSKSFDEFATVFVGRDNYIINFWYMTKNEATDGMENSHLRKKVDNN